MYDNGQQRYGEDDYMEPLMAYLRGSDRIQKYPGIPDDSRFGASPQEIEGIILPEFALLSGTKGTVRNRRWMEASVRNNIAHREYGQTNTWEWFGDPALGGALRFFGGDSGRGGLAWVHGGYVGDRAAFAGFSPVVAYPSRPR